MDAEFTKPNTFHVAYFQADGLDREVLVGSGEGNTIDEARADACRRRNEGRTVPLDYPLEGWERVRVWNPDAGRYDDGPRGQWVRLNGGGQ